MLKKIAAVAVLLLLVVLGVAATKPDTFRVQRSTSIKAPPEKIYAFIDDFHRWGTWSPYEKLDPAMQRTYSGAARGAGAVYEWDGNSKAGKGRMEITDAPAPAKVTIKLDFAKPMEAHNVAEFTLEPRGDSTQVTWSMAGPTPYFAKVIHVFFSMDRMVGKDFETGLANLKALAES
jgi:carbon monoxide dehydrogenase subunit G